MNIHLVVFYLRAHDLRYLKNGILGVGEVPLFILRNSVTATCVNRLVLSRFIAQSMGYGYPT